jgi:Gas vesicle synthesis protein GvpL/GvpF
MIYLYGITKPDACVPQCGGLDDAPLAVARSSALGGLYSTHEHLDPRPQPEALWRHEKVIEAAMETGPALPARFGTTFADEPALCAALEHDAPRLAGQLERLQGCVELAVRVTLPDSAEPVPATGRAYLETKLARLRRHETIAQQTLAPLTELAMRTRTDQGRAETEEICASYLVRRDRVPRFAEQVSALAAEHPDLALSCTGPWPPYSFVELEDAA